MAAAAAAATAAEAEALDKNSPDTGPRIDRDSGEQIPAKQSQDREKVRVLSVDKITLEKIVLERSGGSREVLLTRNESSRKLSIKSELGGESGVSERAKPPPEEARCGNEPATTNSGKFRASDCPPSRQTADDRPWTIEKRLNPVKLIKRHPSSLVEGGRILERVSSCCPGENESRKSGKKREERGGEIEEANAKDRLEKSRTKIEVLQQNLSARIDASTARRYKEELLESRGNRAARKLADVDSNVERLASGKLTFDEEFLQKHNLDRRLKIEEYGLPGSDASREEVEEVEEEEACSSARARKLGYSEKVLEVEKRWSGEFLKDQLDRRSSGGSSKSSYVEELGSVSSSGESEEEDYERGGLGSRALAAPIDLLGSARRTREEIFGDSTLSTVDSDSCCLEERIKSLEQDIEEKEIDDDDDTDDDGAEELDDEQRREVAAECDGNNPRNRQRSARSNESNEVVVSSRATSTDSVDFAVVVGDRFGADGYANLIREFAMEAGGGSSRAAAAAATKQRGEEKQKRKLGLRRLLPGFFSPKDSRKEYKKKESKERKRPDDKHFARYQQNGNYTRSPDTMNLNEDIKRNVKLDNSLNGSIIEERLDEIKRELFPDHPNHPDDQGPITSTPDHLAREDEDREGLLRDRTGASRCYATDSSLSSIAPDERWNERNAQLGISPDTRKFEERQKREEFGQRGYNGGQRRHFGQLERKHSLQEPSAHAAVRPPSSSSSSCFFQRNHGPSGRISAPPSERYLLVRPRAVHPMDRPLPAIPRSRAELLAADYENYYLAEQQEEGDDELTTANRYGGNAYDKPIEHRVPAARRYENEQDDDGPSAGLILKSVSAQVKITRQPIVNQNHRAPLVGRSPKYLSSGSSQKSGDYGDSSCTPNSSQKSEFSPSSSKSGEYYVHSPRNSGSPANGGGECCDDCGDGDSSPSRREAIYENEKRHLVSPPSSMRCASERIYDQTPSSPCEENSANATRQLERRSIDDSLDNGERVVVVVSSSPPKARCRGERSPSDSPGENLLANEKREDEANDRGEEESNCGPASPTGSQGKPISPFGSRQRLPASRRAQPNEQILIASPKRETASCETRIPRRPSNESRRCAMESPVRLSNAPRGSLDRRSQNSGSSKIEARDTDAAASFNDAEISRPEPVYGGQTSLQKRNAEIGSSPPRIQRSPDEQRTSGDEHRVAWVQAHASSPRASPQKPNVPLAREKVQSQTQRSPRSAVESSSRRVEVQSPRTDRNVDGGCLAAAVEMRSLRTQEPRPEAVLYVQRICEPTATGTYGHVQQRGAYNNGPLSPSKQQTRQHLEAFYWQQKALEARRKSLAPPTNPGARQVARKIDLPEVREAMYWQQLKKLDEEQQRRIYEQNATEELPTCCRKNANHLVGQTLLLPSPPSVSVAHGNPTSWIGGDEVGQQNPRCPTKSSTPAGKPPLMQSQKGQNQPVLIVRPQQAIRERRDLAPAASSKALLEPVAIRLQEAPQRSKSASPHFRRGELPLPPPPPPPQTAPRKQLDVSSIYEEEGTNNHVDGKTPSTLMAPPPPPIFKRGSLIGGEPIGAVQEYASAKRVSFSNQSAVGQDLATGNWPTKHGTAPEPPTRRHRSEDSVSDTDSVFSHQEGRRDAVHAIHADGTEYDADRPLPPLPKDVAGVNGGLNRTLGTSVAAGYGEVRWNDPRRAISPQRMLRRNGE